ARKGPRRGGPHGQDARLGGAPPGRLAGRAALRRAPRRRAGRRRCRALAHGGAPHRPGTHRRTPLARPYRSRSRRGVVGSARGAARPPPRAKAPPAPLALSNPPPRSPRPRPPADPPAPPPAGRPPPAPLPATKPAPVSTPAAPPAIESDDRFALDPQRFPVLT